MRVRGKPLLRLRSVLPGSRRIGLETNLEPTSSTPWTPGGGRPPTPPRGVSVGHPGAPQKVWGGKVPSCRRLSYSSLPVASRRGRGGRWSRCAGRWVWPSCASRVEPWGPRKVVPFPSALRLARNSAPSNPAAPSVKPGGPDQARVAITATVCGSHPLGPPGVLGAARGRPSGAAAGGGESPRTPGRLSSRGWGAAPPEGAAAPRKRVAASARRRLGPRRPICHHRPSSNLNPFPHRHSFSRRFRPEGRGRFHFRLHFFYVFKIIKGDLTFKLLTSFVRL